MHLVSLSRLVALVSVCVASAFPLSAASGDLDPVFITGIGAGLTPDSYPAFTSGTGATNAVTLQSDGKIIAGGNVSKFNNTGDLTALKRLLPTGALDTSFNSSGAGLAASSGQPEVNALLRIAGDKLYVGGTFSTYNGVNRSGLVRLNADGSLDTGFDASGLGGSVRYALALAEQADGKLLVGGGFSSVNSTARANLARLHADGSLDTDFAPSALAGSSFVGDIAILPNGQLIVAGGHNRAGGGSAPLLVRLNADGTQDTSLAPSFADDFGDIDELLVLPDGRILIGGDFSFAPSGAFYNFACLLPDGSLDTAFMANVGTGPDGWAGGEIALQPDGTILVGGIFKSWNDQPRASIARVNQDGTLDSSFAPVPYVNDNSYLTHFYSIAVQPDGKLVAGGWLDHVSNPAVETYNLTRFVNEFAPSSPGALRLLSTTAVTAENAGSITLQVSRFGGTSGAVSVQFSTSTGDANGTATAGSDYTTTTGSLSWAAGEGGFKTITVPVLQDAATETSETFTVTLSAPTGGATVPAANAKTLVTVRDDDSLPSITRAPASVSLEQGAGFTLSVRYDSVLAASVKWQRDPDGSGPLGFSDLLGADTPAYTVAAADPLLHAGTYRAVVTNANGFVNSAAATVAISVPAGSVVTTSTALLLNKNISAGTLDASDRPVLVLEGSSGTIPASLVRLVRSEGNPAPVALDSTFTSPTFTTVQGASTTSGSLTSLLILPDGRLVVGGYFSHVNGVSRLVLARFSADGVLDSAYAPALPTATLNTYVQTLAPGAGGKFYAGFLSNGGLRRYAADGSLDANFAPNTTANFFGSTSTNNGVTAILEAPDGRVYIAHRFSTSGFGSPINYFIWRLNADGTRDTSFVSPSPNFNVNALALLPDGRLAFAGQFTSVNGQALARLAIANPDGSLDTGFFRNPGIGASVIHLFYRDGRLLTFGEFDNTSATPRALARYNLDGTRDESFSVGDGANARITAAAFTSTGEIFVGGAFSTINGVSRPKFAWLVGNPQIGAVGFAPSRVIDTERAGSRVLTLRRYGPSTEAASIRWATAGGISSDTSATADADYTAASGTVSWAAGDSADKTITVQLLNDSAEEPSERFRVVLSEPSGPVTAAAAALDFYAAAYALKYRDGLHAGPTQRGFYDRPYVSIADQTGWLWWGGSLAPDPAGLRRWYYTMHPATSSWRPNAVLTRIALKQLPGLPVTLRNTKPDYWFGHDVYPTRGAYPETLHLSPGFTLGSIDRGFGSQITRIHLVATSDSGGPLALTGGHPRKSDHKGNKLAELTYQDGGGRYDQSAQFGPLYLCLSSIPADESADYTFVSLPKDTAPARLDGRWIFPLGDAWVGVIPFTASSAVSADGSRLEITGRPSGFALVAAERSAHPDSAAFSAWLSRSYKLDTSGFARELAVTVTLPDGSTRTVSHNPEGSLATIAPPLAPNDTIYSGPFVHLAGGVLSVSDGRDGYRVDFTGDLPVYSDLPASSPAR